jgi:hypothetical protein
MSIENGIRVPKPIDSKKFEHLKKGVKPIIVCIGDYGDFSEYGQISIREQFKRQPISNHDVDYYEDPVLLEIKIF